MKLTMSSIPSFILEKMKSSTSKFGFYANIELERRFALKLVNDFDNQILQIIKKKRVMIIHQMEWRYDFFNISFLNNAMSLLLYALYEGCIPVISINNGTEYLKWEQFFVQPSQILLGGEIDNSFERIECDRKWGYYTPSMKLAFDLEGQDFYIWRELYKKLIIFNEETSRYIGEEITEKGNLNNTVGVLLRGTDYVSLKPKGHPIQPTVSETLDAVNTYINQYGYEKIYVATEEKKLLDAVISQFGEEKILTNRRRYFDSYYELKKDSVIGEVHFDRDNDNYYKGLEYLSSLNILAKCNGLVAGNCGGTYYSLLIPNTFEHIYIFNKGLY